MNQVSSDNIDPEFVDFFNDKADTINNQVEIMIHQIMWITHFKCEVRADLMRKDELYLSPGLAPLVSNLELAVRKALTLTCLIYDTPFIGPRTCVQVLGQEAKQKSRQSRVEQPVVQLNSYRRNSSTTKKIRRNITNVTGPKSSCQQKFAAVRKGKGSTGQSCKLDKWRRSCV